MNKRYNFKRFTFVGSLLLSLIISLSVFGQNKNALVNNLITPNSVGDIQIGMTIAEARKVFKNATFTQYNYSEEGIWVEVTQGEKTLIRFSTDQKDVGEGDDEGKVAIDESAKIEMIEFDDPQYKTADGIHVGTTIFDAEKKFGKLTKIEFWGLDGSEHAEFANAPKNYSFTVSPKQGSANDIRAGIYGEDEYETKKYSANAYISGIRVSKLEQSINESKTMNSLITKDSVGDIKLGMTVAEARKALSDARFSRSSNGDGLALIAVGNSDETYMTLYAGEDDFEAPIKEDAIIEYIEVWHSQFKTAEGVHVKMRLAEVEAKYGKVKNIMISEIESREYVDFSNQPKEFTFRLTTDKGNFAGIYAKDKRETTKYRAGSSILSISISSPPMLVD